MIQTRWTRGRAGLPMLVVLSILLSACGGTTTSGSPASSAAPTALTSAAPSAAESAATSSEPSAAAANLDPLVPGDPRLITGADGGTFTGAFVGPCCVGVDNMNPMSAGGDYEFLHFIWEHLVTFTVVPNTVSKNPFSGQYGPLAPELADTWTVSSDQLTWTFKLHPGINWSDGTPLTSADVKFSFELCLNPKVGPCYPGGSMSSIKGADAVKAGTTTDLTGVQAPDPGTVTITTTQPNSLLPFNVMDLFILQQSSLKGIDPATMEKNAYFRTPGKAIGTGPFIESAYSAGQSMELKRNDNYWRAKPHLDKIIRREFKDPASALIAFEAGEVDYTYVTADELEHANSITSGTVLPGPSGVDLGLVLNPLKNKDFADKRVRQAFLYAIDRKSILQNIYHIPDPTLLNCLFLDPKINPADVATYPFDPAKAKSLLADAGVDPTKWGELDFDTYYGDQGTLDAMTAIQSNLADVGIKVKITQMDSAAWTKKFYDDGASTMSLEGADGGGAAGGYGIGTLSSKNAWPKGGNGWKGYSYKNDALDAALDAVGTEFDLAKQQTLLQNVCKIDAVEQPVISLWATTRYWFINNKVANFISTPGPGMGNYYKGAETWFLR
ncbi:MAG: ABC transporter substrate-binding protein [Chloroflexota bacterium]